MSSTHRNEMSRRAFGQMAGRAALLFGGAATASAKRKIPVGLQLYSVRQLCAADFPGTVAGVAKLGYQGVEFAGYYDRTAATIRKMLDDNGLKCCGTHTALATLLGDELAKTIEFNKTIGNQYLIVPSLPPERHSSPAAWLETAKLFNEIAAKAEAQGMRVGYHNHTFEFEKMDGQVPFDIFAANTRKDVITQLDVGHILRAGADPIAIIKRYPGRALTVHIKEYSKTKKDALIGEGEVPWQELFKQLEKRGGTQWYIIEEESGAYQGLDGVQRSLEDLRKLGR